MLNVQQSKNARGFFLLVCCELFVIAEAIIAKAFFYSGGFTNVCFLFLIIINVTRLKKCIFIIYVNIHYFYIFSFGRKRKKYYLITRNIGFWGNVPKRRQKLITLIFSSFPYVTVILLYYEYETTIVTRI